MRHLLPILLAFLAVALGAVMLSRTLDPREAPDVVFIVIDTTRADRLSTYGWSRPTSPNLDALAAEGVRFDAHHANSSWTRSSMGTLLTGRYARELGVYEERYDRLPDDARTLPEILHDAGYTTLGLTSNPNINAVFGFDQGFDVWEDSAVVFKFMEAEDDARHFHPKRRPMVDADTVARRALALVDAHKSDKPLYLQVLFVDPHYPYDPPDSALEALGDGAAPYEGEIRQADAGVGRLLAGLADRGIDEQALIVVTSDHGEGLRDHPRVPRAEAHGYTLYDSVTHVPLIVRHPDLPRGAEVSALSSHIDVLPTVLDLVGVPSPEGPGDSLLPRIHGKAGPDAVFMETDWRYCEKTSIRTATHRFNDNPDHRRYREGVHEQGSLPAADVAFLRVLPGTEAYAVGEVPEGPKRGVDATAEGLAPRLAEWNAQVPRRPPEGRDIHDRITLADGTIVPDPWAQEDVTLDEGTAETLKALGYLE
ncbi:MAG: hypothetical protein EP330_17105 [Deltaproteobacteria bacterium]|nr:MAG: hypothetical protein EP330_17105 [Deltaproteobacteria bacterium]